MRVLYFQAGGPTAVINESLRGVKDACKERGWEFYVSRYGLEGLIQDDIRRWDERDDTKLLSRPGSFLGSARISLKKNPEHLLSIFRTLKKNEMDLVLVNGGNDSMDTANRLHRHAIENNLPIHVMGIPKTIDDDLLGTSRTPGFLSAAKYVSLTVSSILLDSVVYRKGRINVIETMGRDNGSLTASASIAHFEIAPDYIYVPEVDVSLKDLLEKAKACYAKKGYCNIVVSEGIHEKGGASILENMEKDAFGNRQLGGVSHTISSILANMGYKTRAIELSIPQRCAFYLTSDIDRRDAYECGKAAVLEGEKESGYMIGIDAGKSFSYHKTPLSFVAEGTCGLDPKYIAPSGDNITAEFEKDYRDLIFASL